MKIQNLLCPNGLNLLEIIQSQGLNIHSNVFYTILEPIRFSQYLLISTYHCRFCDVIIADTHIVISMLKQYTHTHTYIHYLFRLIAVEHDNRSNNNNNGKLQDCMCKVLTAPVNYLLFMHNIAFLAIIADLCDQR